MHGCKGRSLVALVFLCALTGCHDPSLPEKIPDEGNGAVPAVLGEAFDEAATGALSGTVHWQGDLPHVEPFHVLGLPGNYVVDVRKNQANPHLPRIQPSTLALQDAIVFLRKVDLTKSRPWDQPPVRIEQCDRHLVIAQGGAQSNVGWVRAGEVIEIVNQDDHFHMLRGRGAAFFSLPFMDPRVPSRRRLDKPGLVELSSGAFFFWMHGYLLVEQHPYFTRTDAGGHFRLEKVPAGSYDLVCWMPNWEVARKGRDPETGYVIQMDFLPPVEHVRKVLVTAGQCSEASFRWSLADFPKFSDVSLEARPR